MQFHNPYKKNSTITTMVMCAIVFCLFSLSWLYWFQGDLLAVAQHVLSGGQTHYDRTVGAVIITVVLLLLQQVVYRFVGLSIRSHALTYVPSILALAMLGDIEPGTCYRSSLGHWIWAAPLILLVWGGVVWIVRQTLPSGTSKEQTGIFSRCAWLNVIQLVVMMLFVAGTSNSNAVFHYRAHVELAILEDDLDEALRTGNRSEETDVHLTMLRAYALSQKGELGERLFEYPVTGKGDDLLPFMKSRSRTLLLYADSIYHFLGARPIAVGSMNRYFELLERDSLASSAVADYRLCGLLVDKNIDGFVASLPEYYSVDNALPKHYREALTLYTHLRSNPSIVYHEAVMDEDWDNFQELQKQYPMLSERKGKVADRYRSSYWYYYYYANKNMQEDQ
jgi:hypothetical protein